MIDKKMFFLKGAAALVWMMGIASIFGGGFAGAQPIQSIPVGTEAVVKSCPLPQAQNITGIRLSSGNEFHIGKPVVAAGATYDYALIVFAPKKAGVFYDTLEVDEKTGYGPVTHLCQVQAVATEPPTVGFYPPQQQDYYVYENGGMISLAVSRDPYTTADNVFVNVKAISGSAVEGTDFVIENQGALSLPSMTSMQTISIRLIDNNVSGPEKVFDLDLEPFVGSADSGVPAKQGNTHVRIHIIDNESPSARLSTTAVLGQD